MKKFEDFSNEVVESIKERYPDHEIEKKVVTKNNGLALTGVIFRSQESNMAPTIYLDEFYQQYESGKPMDEIMDIVCEIYEKHRTDEDIDMSVFTDWRKARERIEYKIVNTKKNKDLLKEVPHIDFLDLSAVFYVPIQKTERGTATALIRNMHAEAWGVSTEEIFMAAKKNMKEDMRIGYFGYELQFGIMPQFVEIEKAEKGQPMYIITNEEKFNGAKVMMNKESMKKISDLTEGSFFIIPSSVHEIIVVPAEYSVEKEAELGQMVKMVNGTELRPEDILADHVYYYDKESGQIGCGSRAA